MGKLFKRGNKFPLHSNQWNRDLRFLWLGQLGTVKDAQNQHNKVRRGYPGFTGSGGGASSMVAQGFKGDMTLDFPGNAENFVSFGLSDRGVNEEPLTGSVTYIASVYSRVPGSGTEYIVGGTLNASNGFAIVAEGDNTNSAWWAFVREGGTSFHKDVNRRDTTVGNFTDDVVALRLLQASKTLSIWVNGQLGTEGTDAGAAWNTTSSQNHKIGGFAGDNNSARIIGKIRWVAGFNQAVSPAVIWKWAHTRNILDLVCGLEPMTMTEIPPYAVSTTISVGTTALIAGVYAVRTDMTAGADSGGSIPSAPGPGSIWACATAIGVPSQGVVVSGILFPSVNTAIGVSTRASIANLWTCSTTIAVGTAVGSNINGRQNVLASNRYRR